MPVRAISHFTWQVLRTAKRSKRPLTGRALRVAPTPATKDGAFLVKLVDAGLLAVATGGVAAPFEATYALTEKGKHAAEYGEHEYEFVRPSPALQARPGEEVPQEKRPVGRRRKDGGLKR